MNGLKVKGKSVHDICDTLCQMTGTLTFVIIPNQGPKKLQSPKQASSQPTEKTEARQPKRLSTEETSEVVVCLSV